MGLLAFTIPDGIFLPYCTLVFQEKKMDLTATF
jgi:hypothetical protein